MPGTSSETTPALSAPDKPNTDQVAPLDPVSAPFIPQGATSRTSRINASASTNKKDDDSEEDEALKQFVNDDRHFSLVRNFRLADLVTIGNGICGSLSIFSCGHYLASNDKEYLWYGLMFPLLGMFFDFMDGKVARWRKESSMLGQELDSLADSISFGVAPATIAFCLGLRSNLDVFILAIFVCCGVARLARFNATVASIPKDPSGKSKYFEGLPIPSTLGLVAIMMECVRRDLILTGSGLPWGLIEPLQASFGIELHWFTLVFAGWGAAMVSKTLRIPKP